MPVFLTACLSPPEEDTLSIAVWVSHPYLGDGITEIDSYLHLDSLSILEIVGREGKYNIHLENQDNLPKILDKSQNLIDEQLGILVNASDKDLANLSGHLSRERIGLLLSCQLAELHGGQISIQGSPESAYRYVISLPLQTAKPPQLINNET